MFSQIMQGADPLVALRRSEYRRNIHLGTLERATATDRGFEDMRAFIARIIERRLLQPAAEHDGHQTPRAGHPVFIAQHATATCCRKCLYKWHGIPRHRPLTEEEQGFIIGLVLRWIKKEIQTPIETIRTQQKAVTYSSRHMRPLRTGYQRIGQFSRTPRASHSV